MRIAAFALLVCTGCASMPPVDPPNLAGAKDSLSRGRHWYAMGCYAEAARYYRSALDLARLSDEVTLIVRAQNSLGAVALAESKLPEAAALLEQALETALSRPEQPELDKISGNLGALAYQAGRLEDAEELWLGAVRAAGARGGNPALYYCNLARLYLAQGRRDDFARLVELADQAAAQNPDPAVKADALNLRGRLAQDQGRLAEAESCFAAALELDRKSENVNGLAQDTEALGALQLLAGQAREAAGHLDRAFFLWAALGERRNRDRVWALLRQSHQEHGFPKKLTPYEEARQNPQNFLLRNQCP